MNAYARKSFTEARDRTKKRIHVRGIDKFRMPVRNPSVVAKCRLAGSENVLSVQKTVSRDS